MPDTHDPAPKPHKLYNVSSQRFIKNILDASHKIENDDDNVLLFALDSHNNLISSEATNTIKIPGISRTYYYTMKDNGWFYVYDSDMYAMFQNEDGEPYSAWYGNHFTFGYDKLHPGFIKFHRIQYRWDDIRQHYVRYSSYCDLKISEFIASPTHNPQCYVLQKATLTPIRRTLDFVLNEGETMDLITGFIKLGLSKPDIDKPGELLYSGEYHKIITGPKGGQYILVDGTKVYLKSILGDIPVQDKAHKKIDTADKHKETTKGGSRVGKLGPVLESYVAMLTKKHNIKLNSESHVFVCPKTGKCAILLNMVMANGQQSSPFTKTTSKHRKITTTLKDIKKVIRDAKKSTV